MNRSEGRCRSRVMTFQTEGSICVDPKARERTLEKIRVHSGWSAEE